MIVVPLAAQELIARLVVESEPLILKLFVNDHVPGNLDTAATFTEPVGGGYAAIRMAGDDWGIAVKDQVVQILGRRHVFTFTEAQTVRGYFIVQAISGIILGAERFWTPSQGAQLAVTPRLDVTARRF